LDKKYLLAVICCQKDLSGLEGSTALDPQNWALDRQASGWRSILIWALDPSPLLQHFNFS
jgi:hypothetical protein